MTQWFAGNIITAEKLNDGPPTTTTTTGLVVASGWTLSDFRGARNGRNITLDIFLHRSGTTIGAISGNVTDQLMCTAPVGWRPTSGTINGGWDDQVSEGGFVIGTDGLCTLRTSSGDIIGDATDPGNGRNLRLHVDFIIDN